MIGTMLGKLFQVLAISNLRKQLLSVITTLLSLILHDLQYQKMLIIFYKYNLVFLSLSQQQLHNYMYQSCILKHNFLTYVNFIRNLIVNYQNNINYSNCQNLRLLLPFVISYCRLGVYSCSSETATKYLQDMKIIEDQFSSYFTGIYILICVIQKWYLTGKQISINNCIQTVATHSF